MGSPPLTCSSGIIGPVAAKAELVSTEFVAVTVQEVSIGANASCKHALVRTCTRHASRGN